MEAVAHEVVHVMTMVIPAGIFRVQCDIELVEPPGSEHVGRQSLPVQLSRIPYAVDNFGTTRMFSWARLKR